MVNRRRVSKKHSRKHLRKMKHTVRRRRSSRRHMRKQRGGGAPATNQVFIYLYKTDADIVVKKVVAGSGTAPTVAKVNVTKIQISDLNNTTLPNLTNVDVYVGQSSLGVLKWVQMSSAKLNAAGSSITLYDSSSGTDVMLRKSSTATGYATGTAILPKPVAGFKLSIDGLSAGNLGSYMTDSSKLTKDTDAAFPAGDAAIGSNLKIVLTLS